MNAAHEETAPTAAAERLTWAEIQRRFPDEWVVLVDTDWTNGQDFDFGTALVVGHRKRRKDASTLVKAAFESHQDVGCFWTGEIRAPGLRHAVPTLTRAMTVSSAKGRLLVDRIE